MKLARSGRYGTVTQEKAGGATYTPKELADFVADQLLRAAHINTSEGAVKVLDPAVGDGELLLSVLERLEQAGIDALEVHGFETDTRALEAATTRINQRFPNVPLHLERASFLEFVLEHVRPHDNGGLFEKEVVPSYDLIIANPPYVRTQVMGAPQSRLLAAQFGLTGRVDLYHAFIVGMAYVLKAGGVAGVIVSNRFMTTKSGGAVRRAIRQHFDVRRVWDLGDTRLFDAAVLPAVLIAGKRSAEECRSPEFTSIYSTADEATQQATNVVSALGCSGTVELNDGRRFTVNSGVLDVSVPPDAVWRVSSAASNGWLAAVEENTWRRFGDIGRIRVGVKTCADKVFVRTDWEDMPESVRPELLRPLTTHHTSRRFRAAADKKSRYILYPHENVCGQRRAIDLAGYPQSRAYLEEHRTTLEKRTYVTEGGRQWYEIWVPQDPASWSVPKLVFRDIAQEPTFWIDLEGTVVNGDCYWLTSDRAEDADLLWLAVAVANSSFIEAFYDHCFNNKLYAGRRRFITQYVERFPLPDPRTSVGQTIVSLAKQIYDEVGTSKADRLAASLDQLVWGAFGVSEKKSAGSGI